MDLLRQRIVIATMDQWQTKEWIAVKEYTDISHECDVILRCYEKDRRFLLTETARTVIDRWNAFIGTEEGRKVVRLQTQRLARADENFSEALAAEVFGHRRSTSSHKIFDNLSQNYLRTIHLDDARGMEICRNPQVLKYYCELFKGQPIKLATEIESIRFQLVSMTMQGIVLCQQMQQIKSWAQRIVGWDSTEQRAKFVAWLHAEDHSIREIMIRFPAVLGLSKEAYRLPSSRKSVTSFKPVQRASTFPTQNTNSATPIPILHSVIRSPRPNLSPLKRVSVESNPYQ